MKYRFYLLSLLLITLLSLRIFAQNDPETRAVSGYDAELAKKLGADEAGMKQYILVILKTGSNDANIKGKEREELFAGHMANIERLGSQKKLAIAGPFGKNDLAFRGLYIFNVATVEEAQKLTESDPAIKAGIFETVLVPWYGSASLMATYEIHKKITKPAQ
jgi:uncharacterized protein